VRNYGGLRVLCLSSVGSRTGCFHFRSQGVRGSQRAARATYMRSMVSLRATEL
jgi:hypothetical protein